MRTAVCPGSFDPITLGHLDVIGRAAEIFDRVIVAVGVNSGKRYLFDGEERLALAKAAVADIPGVEVELLHGLIADFAREHQATAIVKGLRGVADFDSEQMMAMLNRHLTGIETLFLVSSQELTHVASSYVKDIASHGGSVSALVPPVVAAALSAKFEHEHKLEHKKG